MNQPEISNSSSSTEHLPIQNKDLLKRAPSPQESFFRQMMRLVRDEQGRANSSSALPLALGVSLAILITVLFQASYDNRQNEKIASLQTTVAVLTTPTAPQTPEVRIVEVAESQSTDTLWYRQQEVTIQPVNSFRPSTVNDGDLGGSRHTENLVNWEDIIEVNGVPITGAKLIQVRDPLVTFGYTEDPSTGNVVLDLFRGLRSPIDRQFNVIKLKAVIGNQSGQLESRYIYLPLNTPDSQEYVTGFVRKGPNPVIQVKDGHYKHFPMIGEKDLGEIPANQIGIVTTQ